ncbi:MAG: hypothetical protein CVU59_06940 [Deltaproteobacteria bacterium HGW-Deltaproteobacteria-17]|nr:MAG: hypothetical protein CVU59_06940 [Deltaproteobacteria bacterium HGW-Deltaproteobacteria-17]
MPDIQMAPGAEDVALATMISSMLEQNLESKPGRLKDFNARCANIALDVTDAEAQITLAFSKGTLTVHGGLVNPDIVVSTDSTSLLEMGSLKIKFGMPYYFDKQGMDVIKKLLKGELKIKGLLKHPFALTRFTKVMSVA